MKLQRFPTLSAISSSKRSLYSGQLPHTPQPQPQGIPNVKLSGEEFVATLLDRRWTLPKPDTKIQQVILSSKQVTHPFLEMNEKESQEPSFYVVRDDLLHPLVNGNKSRKLDALFPLVEDHLVTDVVTCGGCQSAHAAAVAVSCAERGIKSHLLLRGEQPEIQTGYNLISSLYGNVTYIPRSVYSDRKNMLRSHADYVAGNSGHVLWFDDILEASITQNNLGSESAQKEAYKDDNTRRVVIVSEGAGDVVALLGSIRLMKYLSQDHLFGKEKPLKLVVDAGTGTTAVGLGLGTICLGLPWEITAVMLADTVEGYQQQEKHLISNFKRHFDLNSIENGLDDIDNGIVHWVERHNPRKFGNVLKGEIEACQDIAQTTGILLDPIYTLSAWEMATALSQTQKESKRDTKVVMLHTGGTLGMFGLAQRYRSYFCNLKR
ncbi:D-cysteine desulfhydrase 2, mitochondrial isoform X1 [Humulus lupulus]|uniref:D-cysteine desulfhydrase 2, mitochondrial isoform X1 n=1 Tax=Humulus lupulus TaxID=3486 RepID=UPI002B4149FB|nr:D-cysteine desulfhydrase 2, mitochondrial isoform X1 [Humulus lupulus]